MALVGKGQRTRAIETANRLGHVAVVSRQCADGTRYDSTSFDKLMRKLAAEQHTYKIDETNRDHEATWRRVARTIQHAQAAAAEAGLGGGR